MSFREIYANEALEQRRTVAQRARFWSKILSFLLMLTVALTLHTEPRLANALMTAAMEAGMEVTGRSTPGPVGSTGLRDRVKVNRPDRALIHAPDQVDIRPAGQLP